MISAIPSCIYLVRLAISDSPPKSGASVVRAAPRAAVAGNRVITVPAAVKTVAASGFLAAFTRETTAPAYSSAPAESLLSRTLTVTSTHRMLV